MKVLAIGRYLQPMAIFGTGLNRADHLVGLWREDGNGAAVLACDVQQVIGTQPKRVRSGKLSWVDIGHVSAFLKIDDCDQMAGVWGVSVDTVAKERDKGPRRRGNNEQLVRLRRKPVQSTSVLSVFGSRNRTVPPILSTAIRPVGSLIAVFIGPVPASLSRGPKC